MIRRLILSLLISWKCTFTSVSQSFSVLKDTFMVIVISTWLGLFLSLNSWKRLNWCRWYNRLSKTLISSNCYQFKSTNPTVNSQNPSSTIHTDAACPNTPTATCTPNSIYGAYFDSCPKMTTNDFSSSRRWDTVDYSRNATTTCHTHCRSRKNYPQWTRSNTISRKYHLRKLTNWTWPNCSISLKQCGN